MNNPTKKAQKPRTGAGSLQRKRDRFTQKMNQIHGVRGYASMREAMDAKYGYIPEDELQKRVARLTNHLIERYSHYTVDEVRSVAALAAVDPNHPALQKYWDEIEAGSNPGSLTSVEIDANLSSMYGDESSTPFEEAVESQTIDSDVGDNDAECLTSADVADGGVSDAEAATFVVGTCEPVGNLLVPSEPAIGEDECSVSSSDSYASAVDADVPMLVCAEVHLRDEDFSPAAESDASPLVSGRDAFPRSPPIRPPRMKRLAPHTVGEVEVSVADVIAVDVMRRVADVSGDASALKLFPQLDPSNRVQHPILYRRGSCLRQRNFTLVCIYRCNSDGYYQWLVFSAVGMIVANPSVSNISRCKTFCIIITNV